MMRSEGRKPKIRAPKRVINSSHGDVNFGDIWEDLSNSFTRIHTRNASDLSYEQLYRLGYRVVLKKLGQQLYTKVVTFERNWLQQDILNRVKLLVAPELLSPTTSTTNIVERRIAADALLKGIKQQWKDHSTCMAMMSDVLMYLDRVYCNDSHEPSVYSTTMSLFYEVVLRSDTGSPNDSYNTILKVVMQTMLDFIQWQREGDAVDKSMLKECTRMLEGLYLTRLEHEDQRLYVAEFEPVFLETSRAFYKDEGERLVRDSDAGAYCRQAAKRIHEEDERCMSTLSPTTAPKIEQVVCDELIRHKIKDIIEMDTGARYMINNDRIDELRLIYELETKVDPKTSELTNAIQQRIRDMGKEINETALSDRGDGSTTVQNHLTQAAIKWVEEVLSLKDRFDRIWDSAFHRDQTLQAAMTVPFRDFINSQNFNRASEYISLFIDENMKKGLKDKTDIEVDQVLDKAIILLQYIQDRDMFERYYKKHLARRLLMAKSVSIDVEKQMIGKMKVELGNSFTSKLEAMFKDMTISEELTAKFKSHVSAMSAADENDTKPVDLAVHVLTSMTWPLDGTAGSDPKSQAVYPPQINKSIERFSRFYAKEHTGRKLTFQPGMGTADLKARFPPLKPGGKERIHELNVSTYAMLVLNLFNTLPTNQSLSFSEIQAATNIPPHDLVRNLQALALAAKTRVLRKEPHSKDVKETDRFFFNEAFQSKFMRVKVGVVAAGNRVESERERIKTEKKVDEDRACTCEAAIVRIMK